MSTYTDRLNGARVADAQAAEDILTAARKGLNVRPVRELAEEVDATPPPQWLAQPVWPADSYGVIGGAHKAGKSWLVDDLTVAASAGLAWLDKWPCTRSGTVLLFAGEGGKRKLVRRLRAVAAQKGVRLEDLPIYVSERVPHLRQADQILAFQAEVEELRPVLVVIDPAYLAVRGTQMSSLVDVGETLEAAQHTCQAAGAALVVSHHFNQSGTGTGAERFSGAGWAEWGRVIVAMTVTAASTNEAGRSSAIVRLEFRGDEIGDQVHEYRREVWADDPDDLGSPMHYELADAGPNLKGARPDKFEAAVDKVLEVVGNTGGLGLRELRAKVGGRAADVDAAIEHLLRTSRIEVEDQGKGKPKRHWVPGRSLRVVK